MILCFLIFLTLHKTFLSYSVVDLTNIDLATIITNHLELPKDQIFSLFFLGFRDILGRFSEFLHLLQFRPPIPQPVNKIYSRVKIWKLYRISGIFYTRYLAGYLVSFARCPDKQMMQTLNKQTFFRTYFNVYKIGVK